MKLWCGARGCRSPTGRDLKPMRPRTRFGHLDSGEGATSVSTCGLQVGARQGLGTSVRERLCESPRGGRIAFFGTTLGHRGEVFAGPKAPTQSSSLSGDEVAARTELAVIGSAVQDHPSTAAAAPAEGGTGVHECVDDDLGAERCGGARVASHGVLALEASAALPVGTPMQSLVWVTLSIALASRASQRAARAPWAPERCPARFPPRRHAARLAVRQRAGHHVVPF
jgi:hypothetical protein